MQNHSSAVELDEADLVRSCQNNEPYAFDRLYQRYGPPLRQYCERRLRGRGDAEDAVQEVMLRAFRAAPRLRDDSRLFPWLRTIAANVCTDIQRYGPRWELGDEALQASGADVAAAHEESARRARLELLDEALAELPARLRYPVILRDLMGWNYQDIADASGHTVSWVRTTLMRGRRLLARRVRALLREEAAWPLAAPIAVLWRRVQKARRSAQVSLDRRAAPLNGGVVYGNGLFALGAGHWAAAAMAVIGMAGTAVTVPVAPVPVDKTVATADAPATSELAAPSPAVAPAAAVAVPREPSITASGAPVHPSRPDGVGLIGATEYLTGSTDVDGVEFDEFTPSPGYEHDGVVYASGHDPYCPGGCAVLFRSRDRGATWERLAGIGLRWRQSVSPSVLLPPTYPADNRIFAAGGVALQVSTDDGATFTTITPSLGAPVMSPRFGRGDDRILLPDIPPRVYDDATGLVRPYSLAAPPTSQDSYTAAVASGFPSDTTTWIGSVEATGTAPGRLIADQGTSIAYVCRDGVCGDPVRLPGARGRPRFLVGHGRSAGVLFAWNSYTLSRSLDGGHSFARIPIPDTEFGPTDVTLDADGTLHAVTTHADHQAGGKRTVLHRSSDGGASWGRPTVAHVPRWYVTSLRVMPDGRLLAGLFAGGIACSLDDGATWNASC